MYNKNHGIPRFFRLDQAKCLVRNQVKTFCNKNNIEIIAAPVKRALKVISHQPLKHILAGNLIPRRT